MTNVDIKNERRAVIDSPQDDKMLLCRPLCGLNDMLHQVEKCWRYAAAHRRALVIDSRESGLLGGFDDYFRLWTDVPTVHLTPWRLQRQTSGRLADWYSGESLKPVAELPLGKCQYVVTSPIPGLPCESSFDFAKAHEVPVLFHQSGGGGSLSFSLIARLTLAHDFCAEVLRRLNRLPNDYYAVHVRNTDYRTDYQTLFERIRPRIAGQNLLVCSDDAAVIDHARRFFSASQIWQSSEIPQMDGMPLHSPTTFKDAASRRTATTNTIVDLLALARAKKLFITHHSQGRYSGYSRLARHLWDNPYLTEQLLGRGDDRPRLLHWHHIRWWHKFKHRLHRRVA